MSYILLQRLPKTDTIGKNYLLVNINHIFYILQLKMTLMTILFFTDSKFCISMTNNSRYAVVFLKP